MILEWLLLGFFVKLSASLMRNYFPKLVGVYSFVLCLNQSKLYDVPVGFEAPPPHSRLYIALFAVAEGWLLLDIHFF